MEMDEEHHIGMTLHALMGSLSTLAEMVKTEEGHKLVRRDIADLELSHALLGSILRSVRVPVKEAAE